jgi:membrane associated rhomboid family serine protease
MAMVAPAPTALQRGGARPTAVYALLLANIAIFIGDHVLQLRPLHGLYLYHRSWCWWQPLSACFCHASRAHLSGNLFLLLLFGRSVEDELGWAGLLFSYAFCGIAASAASLLLLPAATVSMGASGAVFGLFAVSIASRLSWHDLDWRGLLEVVVLAEFVVGRVLSEMRTAAAGGVAGVNHVAHLSGAAAGLAFVLALRAAVGKGDGVPA